MTKILYLSLIPLLLFHLWLAGQFELAHDEAYYWLFSQHLDWGYFDHPPVVALIIKMFSFLPHSEIAVRCGFILIQLVTVVILMSMVNVRRQWLVIMLFFAFPLASYAGLFALPDLPLLFMTTVYCWFLKRYLEKNDIISVLGLSVAIPLLFYSKYHGILVIFFTIVALPKLLQRKNFYLITLLSVLLFMPHVIWQYQHDFSTLRYHFLERPKANFSFIRLAEYIGAQLFLAGLFVGPVVWLSIMKKRPQTDFQKSLKWISLGTVIFFFVSTFSKKFEANWTIFLTAPLILYSADSYFWDNPWIRRLLFVSLGMVFFLRILLVIRPEASNIKRTAEFHGWKNWSKLIQQKCDKPILANTYQMASKLSFYLEKPIHALNYNSRKNQFDFWAPDKAYYPTKDVCYITDKSQFIGEEVLTPDGKKLKLLRLTGPWELKQKSL